MTPPKCVCVWEDCKVIDDPGWVDKPTAPYVWKPYIVESVGFLWYDGPEGIVITDSIAPDHIGTRTQIPRGMIVSLQIEPSPKPDKRKRKV